MLIERDELRTAEDLLERFGLNGELPESILHTFVLERCGRLRLASRERRYGDVTPDCNACLRVLSDTGRG